MTAPATAYLRPRITPPGTDREWMTDALCRQIGPTFTDLHPHTQAAICHGNGDTPTPCPVREACLEYAVDTHRIDELRVCVGIVYGGIQLPDLRSRRRRREQVAS